MPPGALPRESARSLLADAHSALTQRRYRLCLLTLVLTMTLCWEVLYPAPGPLRCPAKEDHPPDAKRAMPRLNGVIVPRGKGVFNL